MQDLLLDSTVAGRSLLFMTVENNQLAGLLKGAEEDRDLGSVFWSSESCTVA